MLRKVLKAGCVLGFIALTLGGCGGGSSKTLTPPPPGNGALFTLISDTPACDLLGFHLMITAFTLRPQGGSTGSEVTVFPTPTSLAPKVEVSSLKDFSTILNLENITAGTYDQATITLTVTSASVFDPTQAPPVANFPVKQTSSSVTVSINPPLVITKSQVSVLKLDFDLQRSVGVDAQGLTGNVTPVFQATPLTASSTEGFGEMDDLVGFVRSVTTSSTGTGFTGGFLFQMLQGTGPALTVNLTSSTQLLGISALKQLLTASFVEVDGFLDSNGNLVANSVRVEDQEAIDQNKVAYLGPVLSVSRDSNGNVTQFSMVARVTEPDDSFQILADSPAVVNVVASSTAFHQSSPSSNFASLSFDPTSLAPGQEVVVHGTFTTTTGQPISIAADSVYLRLQSVEGNFTSLNQAGSDDKTGAFQFSPCGSVFQAVPTIVITTSQTAFVNISGLSDLKPQPSLLVKGVAFFEVQATTINGVQVPAGTLVILAKQVHQL